jgi:hypothetical protein
MRSMHLWWCDRVPVCTRANADTRLFYTRNVAASVADQIFNIARRTRNIASQIGGVDIAVNLGKFSPTLPVNDHLCSSECSINHCQRVDNVHAPPAQG